MFEDSKGVTRSRKSHKDRQYNDQVNKQKQKQQQKDKQRSTKHYIEN